MILNYSSLNIKNVERHVSVICRKSGIENCQASDELFSILFDCREKTAAFVKKVMNKPYRIEFEERPGYLYAHVSGERDSLEISLGFWREIAAECRRSEARRVLIEEDIKECVSMLEMYQIGAEIPRLGFENVLVAFVDPYLEQQELNRFGETVASNRGLRGKFFNDAHEAEKWLLES